MANNRYQWRWVIWGSFFLVLLIQGGCASTQGFPDKAKAGDTITLAVGSPDGMTRDNILVTYTPDSDPLNPVDISSGIRAVFNLYPDRSSKSWLYDGTPFSIGTLVGDSGHAPWLTVVAVDLPTTGLTVGSGKVNVIPLSAEIEYNPAAEDITLVDMQLEILAGVGAPNPLSFLPVTGGSPVSRALTELEPVNQISVRPPTTGDAQTPFYGAIQLELQLPLLSATSQPILDSEIFVILDELGSATLDSQAHLNWVRNGDIFTVMVVGPKGMGYRQSRFAVVAPPGSQFGTASLQSVSYFGLDGSSFPGPLTTDYSIVEVGISP